MQSTHGDKKISPINVFAAGAAFIARPILLIWKLISDERYRIRMNVEITKKAMKLPISPIHKKAFIGAVLAFCLAVIFGYRFFLAASKTMALLVAVVTSKNSAISGAIAPLRKMDVNYGLNLLGAILLANIIYFFVYEWKFSGRKTLIRAFGSRGLGVEADGTAKEDSKLRVYSNRLVVLETLTSQDKLHEEAAFWRAARFNPSEPTLLSGGNKYLWVAAALKPSTSTIWTDRLPEWRQLMAATYVGSISRQVGVPKEDRRAPQWYYGEYVNQNEVKLKRCEDDFSGAFIGMSGSGKTEAMKPWILHAKATNPSMRLFIADLKEAGDWKVFKDYTEFGRIVYTADETFKTLAYLMAVYESRKEYMQRKGYKSVREWMEVEKVDVPLCLLIIDEFPAMVGPLKYDQQEKKAGTPANILFTFMTRGRSYGVWTFLASQFGNYDYIPASVAKNMTSKVILKVGSSGEANLWLDNDLPFQFGKGMLRKPDGTIDAQKGYACVDKCAEYVRFWYMTNEQILGEFNRYKVPKTLAIDPQFMPAAELMSESKPIIAADTSDQPKNIIEKWKWRVFPSSKPQDDFVWELPPTEPLAPLPLPDESFEDYGKRVIPAFMGLGGPKALPAANASSGASLLQPEKTWSQGVTASPSLQSVAQLPAANMGNQGLSARSTEESTVARDKQALKTPEPMKAAPSAGASEGPKPSGVESFISKLRTKPTKKPTTPP